ncbi:MAG: hypothetical protein OEU92_01350 [Alphaproteobacteria bacterium]|nr:hypothetical protein [Alphaproteobacteria bacterium]
MSGFRLELKLFEARFRLRFSHASASRSKAASAICIARGVDGAIGYGEGCPRDYVTGETMGTVVAAFERFKSKVEPTVRDLATLRHWIDVNRTAIDANPAAFAAIEIALLDLFAKRAGQPMEAFLGLDPPPEVKVTAVFGIAGAVASGLLAAGYRAIGMTDAKVKLSPDPRADHRRIGIISRMLGSTARLRVDANNLFDNVLDCGRHLRAIDAPVWAIEEPLRPRDLDGQERLAIETGVRIILDESAVCPGDLDGCEGGHWVVNLRVSKHGGLLRSLEMAEAARSRGLEVIVGSHVGETSLLARSALTLAAFCGDRLLAAECGYGSFLLQRDPADPGLRFGNKGRLELPRAGGDAGLGLTVDEAALMAPTDGQGHEIARERPKQAVKSSRPS